MSGIHSREAAWATHCANVGMGGAGAQLDPYDQQAVLPPGVRTCQARVSARDQQCPAENEGGGGEIGSDLQRPGKVRAGPARRQATFGHTLQGVAPQYSGYLHF